MFNVNQLETYSTIQLLFFLIFLFSTIQLFNYSLIQHRLGFRFRLSLG